MTRRASLIAFGLGALLAATAASLSAHELSWRTVDCGGGASSGGAFELVGTIGQADAGGVMAGGAFAVTGGFWTTAGERCRPDLDGSGAVDVGDILAVLGAWGNPGGPEDLDDSGTVDVGDLLIVLAAWGPCD